RRAKPEALLMMTQASAQAMQPASASVTTAEEGARQYIYAIVRAGAGDIETLEGIGGKLVQAIVEGRVAALVSVMEMARIRPERRNLAAHHGVLKSLMASGAVPLPMSFGILGDSPQAVRSMLARNQTTLLAQLDRVADK